MTPNDIHGNQTTSFVRIQQGKLQAVGRIVLDFFVLPGTIDNSVLSLIILVLSFKGIHNGICNLRFFSVCTSLLQEWMSMTLHSPVRCSVTRWITRMGSTSCRWVHLLHGSKLIFDSYVLSRPSQS